MEVVGVVPRWRLLDDFLPGPFEAAVDEPLRFLRLDPGDGDVELLTVMPSTLDGQITTITFATPNAAITF
ncbi:hypothetical protein GCM10007338_02770 [Corynebacterium pelargi]|nr:hypothetical protein GCM10007338_02770 [Corynebacterium pelargi]